MSGAGIEPALKPYPVNEKSEFEFVLRQQS